MILSIFEEDEKRSEKYIDIILTEKALKINLYE
jgi:hypothetical protein